MTQTAEQSKSLKDVKIFIPEIPAHWTKRSRRGHTNTWYEPGEPEISLEPPIKGLYAERFDDGWYWVCGCGGCLGELNKHSYILCDEHDRCIDCGTHRDDLTDIPWHGYYVGFQCRPCHEKEKAERKAEAIAAAKAKNHSEDDCKDTDKIICPTCASVHPRDDINTSGLYPVKCHVCDEPFWVEAEQIVIYNFTSRKGKERN